MSKWRGIRGRIFFCISDSFLHGFCVIAAYILHVFCVIFTEEDDLYLRMICASSTHFCKNVAWFLCHFHEKYRYYRRRYTETYLRDNSCKNHAKIMRKPSKILRCDSVYRIMQNSRKNHAESCQKHAKITQNSRETHVHQKKHQNHKPKFIFG